MASEEAQKDWRGKSSSIEGVATTVPYKGHAGKILKTIERGVKSGFSYTGARTFLEFQTKAKFIRQTVSSQVESSTHILRVNK
jgi:IMP dehydrogenase